MTRHIHTKIIILLAILFGSILYSCTEVIEEDLTETKVTVNMPFNNYTASKSYIQFWWNEVLGADKYKLQVVSPQFDSIIILNIDSNITGTKFEWSFTPGEYQWRIQAYNESSSTSFQTYSFNIDSSLDLSNNQIILVSPIPNIYTNSDAIYFSWIEEYSADYYTINITDSLNIPVVNSVRVYPNYVSVPSQTISTSLPEGVFEWGIKAENSVSSTQYSKATFIIDRTKPEKPTLIKPSDYWMNHSDTVYFQWISGNDKYPNYDSVYVYLDSTFISKVRSYKISGNSIVDTLSQGTYYWQAQSFDKAGNIGKLSDVNRFRVN